MDEAIDNPVSFSKGINLRELMGDGSEFHIDMDFKRKQDFLVNDDDDFPGLTDDDDSDSEDNDLIKRIEDKTDKMLLASPEYHSFDELEKKMIDCLPNGDIKMMIMEEGDGPLIPSDSELTLHYSAYWERADIPFDSTLTVNQGLPKRLRLGSGNMIPGLEIGLTCVKGPTARVILLIRPALAWGKLGVPPRIKPETALFVVMVYSVIHANDAFRFNKLPEAEKSKFEVTVKTVKSLHTLAKEQFSKKHYKKAISYYQQSINVINLSRPQGQDEESETKSLKVNSILNLAVCFYKIEKPKHILRMLDNLDFLIDVEKHCKALFYYGRAYELQGKVENAIEYYKKALKIEPRNKDIGKALDNLDGYLKSSFKKEKVMWRSVFKTDNTESYDVDKDFQDGVEDMLSDLTKSGEYAKFDLPNGLTENEVACVKSLTEKFDNLVVLEDGEGRRKKVTIVKKIE